MSSLALENLNAPRLHLDEVEPWSRRRVLIVALQSGKKADGGLESLTQLVCRYSRTQVRLRTQVESEKTARWRLAGHEVEIVPLPYRPGERALGSRLFSRLRTLWHHARWNVTLAWQAHRQNFHVVHVNDPHALWHCGPGLWLMGIPVLFNIRDTKPRVTRFEQWKWRLAFSLSARQVVLSREMGAFWSQVVSPWIRGAVEPIYSVVDAKRFTQGGRSRSEIRNQAGLSEQDFCVGYIASFSPKKAQLEFILRTAETIVAAPANLKILFIGDFDPASDPYAGACADAVKKAGLETRLIFLGYRSDVQEWYGALDLVVVATLNEGLARCMIEAMAAGTPVVSFSVCSAREILHSESHPCGLVVEQGDYPGLLRALLKARMRPDLRALWGENAKKRARELFNPEANTRRYEDVYRELAP